jgi:peptidoglycan/xylan/chitin deacetylase (PgdA/CDA1 family)
MTFDDGPGDPAPDGKTLAIAEFLHQEKITATFFVVGQRIEQPGGRGTLSELRKMGHLIGNHTFSHANLAELVRENKQRVVDELVDTHRIIADFVGPGPLFFRAPFFAWNEAVWEALKSVVQLQAYQGPIGPDVICYDWDIGREREGTVWTGADCQGHLWGQLRILEKGIVLLHDSSADRLLNERHYRREQEVYELTKWLVRWLKRENYEFVGLDRLMS